MRKLEYLSPTSFSCWKKNKEEFYVRYLSEVRVPREPQNEPMALGSAVDGLLKNYIFQCIYGEPGKVPGGEKYELETIIEAQVEEHNRIRIMDHAKYVFEQYRSSGALGDLMTEVSRGSGVRMEFDLKGTVSGYREGIEKNISTSEPTSISKNVVSGASDSSNSGSPIRSLTLLGKPDLSFVTDQGLHIVLDWKVNGYFSKWNTSPMKGYVRLRSGGGVNLGMHKGSHFCTEKGVTINFSNYLNDLNEDWGCQMAVYNWLTGEPVGSEDFIVGIDQIVCNGGGVSGSGGTLPTIKIAEHRLRINGEYQRKLFNQMIDCVETVASGWIFRDITETDSKERCKMIDESNMKMISGESRDSFLEDLLR